MASNNLPSNWSLVKLGNVCEFIYGKGLTKSNRNESGKFPVYGSNGIVGYHNEYLVEGPCLIIGRKGAAGEVRALVAGVVGTRAVHRRGGSIRTAVRHRVAARNTRSAVGPAEHHI